TKAFAQRNTWSLGVKGHQRCGPRDPVKLRFWVTRLGRLMPPTAKLPRFVVMFPGLVEFVGVEAATGGEGVHVKQDIRTSCAIELRSEPRQCDVQRAVMVTAGVREVENDVVKQLGHCGEVPVSTQIPHGQPEQRSMAVG